MNQFLIAAMLVGSLMDGAFAANTEIPKNPADLASFCQQNKAYCLGLMRGQISALGAAGVPQFLQCIPPDVSDEKALDLTLERIRTRPADHGDPLVWMTEALFSSYCEPAPK